MAKFKSFKNVSQRSWSRSQAHHTWLSNKFGKGFISQGVKLAVKIQGPPGPLEKKILGAQQKN